MSSTTALSRPALRYYGGKWRLALWLIAHMPPHMCYVEPFGGAASVLLRKPPTVFDVYNDRDELVVNFFRVLREQPDALVRLLELTPWSRAVAARLRAVQIECDDAVAVMRRFDGPQTLFDVHEVNP